MNKFAIIVFGVIAYGAVLNAATPAPNAAVAKVASSLAWSGQASIMLKVADKVVYIDPLNLPGNSPKADLILITHSHGDHLSAIDIDKVADAAKTLIAGPADVVSQVSGWWTGKTAALQPGQAATLQGVAVEAVAAYNIKKASNHPKPNNWLGYVVIVDGVRLYHCGDTERIPEMKDVKADIILVPLGQTYTMNSVQEATEAVLDSGASIAMPIHFGMYEGSAADADAFAKLLAGKAVKVQRLVQKN